MNPASEMVNRAHCSVVKEYQKKSTLKRGLLLGPSRLLGYAGEIGFLRTA